MNAVPPLYAIEKIARFKTLADPERPYKFAELQLGEKLLRYCVSSRLSEWRVATLFTKEPATIAWLESFKADDVFIDIGANVGMYSLYAGVMRGARVFAFEPESQNYAELNRSIFLNAAHEKITAYCAGLGPTSTLTTLLLNGMTTGGSFHDLSTPSHDYARASRFAQGAVSFALDQLIAGGAVMQPTHIKIDVDGHEDKVLAGMTATLALPGLRTLLVECDPALAHTKNIIDKLLAQGWQYSVDQLRLSPGGVMTAEQATQEMNERRYAGNVIFARDKADLQFAAQALERAAA